MLCYDLILYFDPNIPFSNFQINNLKLLGITNGSKQDTNAIFDNINNLYSTEMNVNVTNWNMWNLKKISGFSWIPFQHCCTLRIFELK